MMNRSFKPYDKGQWRKYQGSIDVLIAELLQAQKSMGCE